MNEGDDPAAATLSKPEAWPNLGTPLFLTSPHTAMTSTQRPIVFMDVNIGETPAGRLKMELFSDIVPKYVALGRSFVHPPPIDLLFFQDCREFPSAVHRRVQG